MASGDSSFEVMCQLAMAHCLVGCVNTMQEQYPFEGMVLLLCSKMSAGPQPVSFFKIGQFSRAQQTVVLESLGSWRPEFL